MEALHTLKLNKMLKETIELLQMEKFYNVSGNVEIAKGKYKIPQSVSEGLTQIKRQWRLKKQ